MADPPPVAVANVAAHYDAVASVAPPPAADAEVARLKRAHNAAKERLVRAHCGGKRVLDLACGRGGDVRKWQRAEVASVLGLDASAASVREARERARAIGLRRASFATCSDVGRRDDLVVAAPADVVTCMMALHYFFATPRQAACALKFARRHLVAGGRFVGVAPDGDRTRAFLQERGGAYESGGALVKTLRASADGRSCAVSLRGTVLHREQTEPFLFEAEFREACDAANLHVRRFDRPPPESEGVFLVSFECVAA